MFLLVEIGCIECGSPSEIVGNFHKKDDAEKYRLYCDEKFSWRTGGQNSFEIFEIPEGEFINGIFRDSP